MRNMVKGLVFVFCFALLISSIAMAETKISYDGQIRLRLELSNKSFAQARHAQQYNDLRTRLGLTVEPTDMARIYIQFQDSRRLGDPSSGGLTSTDNVDLHQVYFEIRCPRQESLYLKGGRFEVNYGNQRVFGAVGWHNIGRSWEGLMASFRPQKVQLDLFWLKKIEMNATDYNRDFDIVGAYFKIKKAHLDLFGFYELDADSNDYVQAKLKRFNTGAFYKNNFNNFDFLLQGNAQFGKVPAEMYLPDSSTLVQDISAFMINGEFGYNFEGKGKARLALGFDYTSGDDGTDSTKYKAYTNAYYTGHAFRGYMDYFLGSPTTGLIDIILRSKVSPTPRWLLKGDFHYFQTAEDYASAVDGSATSKLGYEADITIVNKSLNGATFSGGVSMFIPEDDYAGTNNKAGLWGYLMTTVNF